MTAGKPSNQAKRPTGKTSREGLGRRLLWIAGGIVVLGGAVFLAVDVTAPLPPPPVELEATETFEGLNPVHLEPGAPLPEYNSDPPTSGPHNPDPAPCGIYTEPVSDQAYLHSMEHGAVVVQYDESLTPDEIANLEQIVRSNGREIILAPRPDNPDRISLSAWTKLLLVDEVDADIVNGFERGFGNAFSPEPGAVCPFQVDQG